MRIRLRPLLLFAVLAVPFGAGRFLNAGDVPCIATSRDRFTIPFRQDPAEMQRLGAREIQLYVSVDDGKTWNAEQSIAPTDQEFVFVPRADGTFLFSVAVSDASGQLHPDPRTSPAGLKVIVDRQRPQLELELRRAEPERVELAWNATDQHLAIETLQLEYRNTPTENWKTVYVSPKPSGQTSWKITGGMLPEVRGKIADIAGNICETRIRLNTIDLASGTTAGTTVTATGRSESVPSLAPPALPLIEPRKQAADAVPNAPPHSAAMPPAVGSFPSGSAASGSSPTGPSLSASAVAGDHPFPGEPAAIRAAQHSPSAHSGYSKTAKSAHDSGVPLRYLNTHEFQIEYQVTGVGPSGVGVVELYVTQDEGRQWWRYGVDPDLTSPMTVKVPADGSYGFHFRIHSGIGNAEDPPQPGQAPQIQVIVDSNPPRIDILNVYQGHGANINLLTVQWDFRDEQPLEKPVSLYLAGSPAGPWQQVESRLENSGSHTLKLPPNTPTRLFVKVQGVDAAGNVASAIRDEPILIDLSRPSARVLTIDAVR